MAKIKYKRISRRTCATANPSEYQINRNDERLRSLRKRVSKTSKFIIDVQFIHLTDGKEGRLTKTRRVKQISVLNQAFSKYGISFEYDEAEVRVVDNAEWYGMDHGSIAERDAKTKLHSSPERHLNFYTAGLSGGLLGWATFPWEVDGNRDMDGVVVLDRSLPGGTAKPFDLGITAVHEVGHWLGLYHTFQDGCLLIGDHVQDTPAHSSPNYGKPNDTKPNGACIEGELAPVHNFMNYCDDEWLCEFTEEQITRVRKNLMQYRSKFLKKKAKR